MVSFRLTGATLSVAACLLQVVAAPSVQAAAYTVTDLGALSPSGGSSFAADVNAAGHTVGASTDATNAFFRAVSWTSGGIVDLGTLGGFQATAQAVNDGGQIVGQSTTTGFTPWHATYWQTRAHAPVDLGALGGFSDSGAHDINNAGQIVGVSNSSSGDQIRATFWASATTLPIDLGTLGGTMGSAQGINHSGQIVGVSSVAGDAELHATLWSSSADAPLDLGTLGGTRSFARDINDAGRVVGSSNFAGSGTSTRAFLWDGAMTPLESLASGTSEAWAINNAGLAVGSSATAEGEVHATLWHGVSITDINTVLDASGIGWLIRDARGVNDGGQIVGFGRSPQGRYHAVLLTFCELCEPVQTLPPPAPIPEPATYALLMAGLAALGAATKRRRRARECASPA